MGKYMTRQGGKEIFFYLTILFFIVSMIGWGLETVYFVIRWDTFIDRGFLTMPLCPIYGFCLIGIYLALGTPTQGRLAPLFERAKRQKPAVRALAYAGLFLLYFVIAALLPTVAELATGAFFDKALGVKLWDYSYKKFDLFGYVSLDQTLQWGAMITLAMTFLWDPLFSLIKKIPSRAAKVVACVLAALVLADFVFNIVWLCGTGAHLDLY